MIRVFVCVLAMVTMAWADCATEGKLCGSNNPACCDGLVCVHDTGSHCRAVVTPSTTTTVPDTVPDTSTTLVTTTTEPSSEPTTSTTNPDVVQFPALRATPMMVNWKHYRQTENQGPGWWEPTGRYASQPERAAMQGEMLVLVGGELARYTRRMGLPGEQGKINDLLTISGGRFFGQTGAYEGRVYPPQLDPWSINRQGAGDLYQFAWYRARSVQSASLDRAKKCATMATPAVLDYLDLTVVNGACVKANSLEPPHGADEPERGNEGMLNGAKVFTLNDVEKAALQVTHPLHVAVSKWRCDKTLPPYAGAVQAAHIAYENVVGSQPGATAEKQHFARMPDFAGYADTYSNRRPDDPDDPALYWTDQDECDWGKIQDEAHGLWMERQLAGQWGPSQMMGRLHQFTHICLGYKSEGYTLEFPPANGQRNDNLPAMTCAEYLATFRATGALP